MLGEEKRSIINVNLKKYARQIQHHVTDLKMELLAKIVNDCINYKLFSQKSTILDVSQVLSSSLTSTNKSFLRTTKELYHGFLEWWLLLPSRDFTCSKSTIETLKTLEHNVKCV